MKTWTIALFLMCSTAFAGQLSLSKNELKELNRERKDNGLEVILDTKQVDTVIQNDLDRRLEQNLQRLQEKKALLPSMPVMEKWGAENVDRETKRKNHWRDANESIKQDNAAKK